MSKARKLLDQMRVNPRDWPMETLEAIAERYGITVRKNGGSHFVFLHPNAVQPITIPCRRPIKPVYIRQFLLLLDEIGVKP